jgi:carotenoid 1,2-hydratase
VIDPVIDPPQPPPTRTTSEGCLGWRFDAPVVPGGYRWWYVDGISDCGRHAITLIAFIGSVFSPYYATRRRHDPTADPTEHVSINVALYPAGRRFWAMTERGRTALLRSAQALRIGPSSLEWDGTSLHASIDERMAPWPSRMRGRLVVTPEVMTSHAIALDDADRHRWTPMAPRSRIEVRFEEPSIRFEGHAYADGNVGTEPLEAAFEGWQWSRGRRGPDTLVHYAMQPRHAPPRTLSLCIDTGGRLLDVEPGVRADVAGTLWGIDRHTQADRPNGATVLRTLESGPFYARSLIQSTLGGAELVSVHESLSLDRFRSRLVQVLLPVRMPRRAI